MGRPVKRHDTGRVRTQWWVNKSFAATHQLRNGVAPVRSKVASSLQRDVVAPCRAAHDTSARNVVLYRNVQDYPKPGDRAARCRHHALVKDDGSHALLDALKRDGELGDVGRASQVGGARCRRHGDTSYAR